MLKYTSMNLEKKRELNKAHEANARAAKKASLKRKLDSPTPSGPGGETQGLHGEIYHFTPLVMFLYTPHNEHVTKWLF